MADEPWTPPLTPDGNIDWTSPAGAAYDPSFSFMKSKEEKNEAIRLLAEMAKDQRAAEEAGLEKAKLKAGVQIAPPMAPLDAIQLDFAMASDTATIDLKYLVDPYLPSRCVVGFFGRGSTAKSTLLGTMAAQISCDYSTLWMSVEEQKDWIKVRHRKCGGAEGTLAVATAIANKSDKHGRVIGSTLDLYEHLAPAIIKAKASFESIYNPPRPLRLVVLDTAVGLTGWRKGESPNDDASVKRLLAYLQALAEKFDVTIAIIGHSNKGKHEHFADTVAGASAWTNSPRLSFIHARDVREEYACVMRVAKTNLTTRFGVSYKTVPVHTLHRREEGADSVLCRVDLGPLVWGEEDSMDLFEEATKKPKEEDEDGEGGHKQTLVDKALNVLLDAVHRTTEPVTRDLVHHWLGREVSRREWSKIDNKLRAGAQQWGVIMESGPQNKAIYRKQA